MGITELPRIGVADADDHSHGAEERFWGFAPYDGRMYSAICTRGVSNISDDMDLAGSTLLNEHGYAS